MYLDKLIKREFMVLLVSVITITIIILAVFYINNSNMDNNRDNIITIDNLKIKYCEDVSCKQSYSNYGSVIGTIHKNGESNIRVINKYDMDTEALKEEPYVINIANTGDKTSTLTLLLEEDKDYKPYGNIDNLKKLANLYMNNIKIGISNCSNGLDKENVSIKLYNELENHILLEDTILGNKNNTYCIWTWISNVEEEIDKSYFVAKIDFKSKLND